MHVSRQNEEQATLAFVAAGNGDIIEIQAPNALPSNFPAKTEERKKERKRERERVPDILFP